MSEATVIVPGRTTGRGSFEPMYIWKAPWYLHAAGFPAAEDWVAVKALAVLAGDSARAAAQISAEADAADLTGTRRHRLRAWKPCSVTRSLP